MNSMPEFISQGLRTARVAHKCSECSGTIKQGDKYEVVTGKLDGYIKTFKTCEPCRVLRMKYDFLMFEFGFSDEYQGAFGELLCAVEYALTDVWPADSKKLDITKALDAAKARRAKQ